MIKLKPLLHLTITLISLIAFPAYAEKRVLFIGNSYTAVNNLPQLVRDVAISTGDTVVFDSYTPGGYTFQAHSTDANALAKIAVGTWDVVVLQEQSQRPSFPLSQVQSSVFPYARALDSLIHLSNSCTETMFYMTWGRKNGDASNCSVWPPVCTYAGMDSLLHLRYMMMGYDNNAVVSPVGAVWNYIRENYPLIELYSSDESHPSYAGSYAAACTFYTALFRKDPSQVTFIGSLDSTTAAQIRFSVKGMVYDSLSNWYIDRYDPLPSFTHSSTGLSTDFINTSTNSTNYLWDFGDVTTDTAVNPTHLYSLPGTYTVTLTAYRCGTDVSTSGTVEVIVSTLAHSNTQQITFYPNPVSDYLYLTTFREQAELFSIDGKKMNVLPVFNGKNYFMDLSEIKNGIYILQTGTQRAKIMVIH